MGRLRDQVTIDLFPGQVLEVGAVRVKYSKEEGGFLGWQDCRLAHGAEGKDNTKPSTPGPTVTSGWGARDATAYPGVSFI